jgi:alpha-D-ribose 1-methylphosphonate 5-triphosphate diphosphatase
MVDELTLKNARIVLPAEVVEGSVHLRNGLIADIQSGPVESARAIDLEGDFLIPGLVDLHTDNYERHVRPRPNADWPVLPALLAHDAQMVSSGITTILDSLCVGVESSWSRSFDTLKKTLSALETGRREGLFRGDHLLHLRTEVSCERIVEEFTSVYPAPYVLMVSMMDHKRKSRGDGDTSAASEKRDSRPSQEDIDEFLKRGQEYHERVSVPNRAKVLSRLEGHLIALASHDDETAEQVKQSHADGIAICEFPTTVEAAETARTKGMHIVAGSPNLVLGRSHSGNVAVEELARRGLLDVLASDYVPSSLLHGAFLLHEKIGMPLDRAIAMVSLVPARLAGLNDRGSIEIGKRADLVRVKKAQGLPLPLTVWREGVRV